MSGITDAQLDAARTLIDGPTKLSRRQAAARVGVPESTLRYHLNGRSRSSGEEQRTDLFDGLDEEPSSEFAGVPVIVRDFSHQPSHLVYPLGDIHLGSPAHAADRWQQWREYLERTDGVSMLNTGDNFNAALKDSKSEAYDEVLTVGKAIKLFRRQMAPLAEQGKLDVLFDGNHEDRIYRATGISPADQIADALGVPWSRTAALMVYIVGDIEYEVYVRHGTGMAGGAIGSRANAMEKAAKAIIADVYVSAHTHSQLVARDRVFKRDRERNVLVPRRRLFISSGSFLNYEEYAATRSYVSTDIGAPRIRLDGRKRDVHVSV